jgi:hypothetical protein
MKQHIASILVLTILFTACATTPPSKAVPKPKPQNVKEWIAQNRPAHSALAGAIIGGVLGGASGILQGRNSDEVFARIIAGATVGALAGFAVGKHKDRIYAGRDLAIRYAGYDNSQGYIARIEAVSFDPAAPKPGQSATLSVRYLVLGPDPNEALKVQMFRGLKYGEDYVFGVGPNEFVVPKGGGIVDSSVELTLPKKAPAGTYSIEAMLEDANKRFPEAVGTAPLYIVASAEQRTGAEAPAR